MGECPYRCRTWIPRGQTPVLQFHFNWKTISAIADITWWTFNFGLFPGTARSPQVVEFLSHLMRHIPGNLPVIWDGLRCHRSRLVHDFVHASAGRLPIEFVPVYAPELNPVEYIWGHWKQHDLPICVEIDKFLGLKSADRACNYGTCVRSLIVFGNGRIVKAPDFLAFTLNL